MRDPVREPKLTWRRGRGGVALAVGLLALAAAVASMLVSVETPVAPVTLTAEFLGTTRALVTRTLIVAAASRGVEVRLVETARTDDELDKVDTGAVDFALVPSAFRVGHRPHVREVAPLYVEAVHLLVREELGEAVARHIGALRGHVVDVGPRGTATDGLAEAIMVFAGLEAGDGTKGGAVTIHRLEYEELQARLARHDPSALPDAVFFLATVPSKIAAQLVAAHYRLVALPFADAFRLGALVSDNTAGN